MRGNSKTRPREQGLHHLDGAASPAPDARDPQAAASARKLVVLHGDLDADCATLHAAWPTS